LFVTCLAGIDVKYFTSLRIRPLNNLFYRSGTLDFFAHFFVQVLAQAEAAAPVSDEDFSVDGTLMKPACGDNTKSLML
jgi:hypothetical protein